MMPIMMFLEKIGLELWINLMLGQFFGALIFWKVDRWIFERKNNENKSE